MLISYFLIIIRKHLPQFITFIVAKFIFTKKWKSGLLILVLMFCLLNQTNKKTEEKRLLKKKKHLICDAISSVYNVISYNLITELNFYDHVTVL